MDPLLKKLTIGIPVYNEEKFILQTLESCVHQAGTILISDNCSTDRTSDICEEFANRHSNVFYIRNDSNIGMLQNFKRPLSQCETEYFQWLGAHDILGKDYTRPLLEAAEKDTSISLVYGKTIAINENNQILKKKSRTRYTPDAHSDSPFERLLDYVKNLKDGFIFHGVFRTDILRQSWLDTPCIGNDDALLFNTVAAGKTVYVSDSILYARDFPQMRKNIDDNERRTKVIVAENAPPLTDDLKPMLQSMMTTAVGIANTKSELAQAFEVLNEIYLRHLEPKSKRRKRRTKQRLFIALAVIAIAFVIFTIIQFLI
tara:strand:- start:1222 stop:2166 length:945 start_codon:yes stop_codon:yes gene_type:complete